MSKIVQKGNKQLTIDDNALDSYLELGFSEVNEKGNVVTNGKATTLKDVQAENSTLKAELAKYQSINLEEVETIKTENESLKAELEKLKVDKKSK